MLTRRILAVLVIAALPAAAQLTSDQKVFDFQALAAIYSKRYAPLDWKIANFNIDPMTIGPWLDAAANTATDLDFYDLMVQYVAQLHDGHDSYHLPSDFSASLGFTVDLYDGRVLIDSINRTLLPAATYPFAVGDQLLAVDGVAIGDLMQQFANYARYGNDRSTARVSAARAVTRPQQLMPYAALLPETAVVRIARNGVPQDYVIKWNKTGTPLLQIDPVNGPHRAPSIATPAATDPLLPPDANPLEVSYAGTPQGVLGVGALAPVFSNAMPAGFVRRLGASTDFFYSGTFTASGYKIGFIRIPTYGPSDTTLALAQFQSEIAYMQANTDGLIVDQMHNPGGTLCYGENIVANLIPVNFRPIGYQIRATYEYLQLYYERLLSAQTSNNQTLIAQYQPLYNAILNAYSGNQRLTDTVPLCTGSFNRAPASSGGKVIAYSKPLIMLIDEFSMSTADSVPAMIQDNARGPLVGWRTNGMGGSNSLNISRFQVGAYSEGDTGVTLSLMVRAKPINTDEYGPTAYIENAGVRPDIQVDYMTADNLSTGGKAFVQSITDAMVKQIKGN